MANKIGWCTDTINSITGCLNNCPYCYARKFATRHAGRFGYPQDDPFRPTFHPDKLQRIYNLHGAGKRVFLDSMGDWFSEGVDQAWVEATVAAVKAKPNHTFLVLTKCPENMPILEPLANLWVGVSINTQADIDRIGYLRIHYAGKKFVSIEPLQGPIDSDFKGIDWVIIGAESGNRKGKITPKPFWVESILAKCKKTPVFMKDNLMPYLEGIYCQSEELPREMR